MVSIAPVAVPVRTRRSQRRMRRLLFWIRRYLPAEVAGTLTMLAVGALASTFTTSAPVIAVIAVVAECLGFYGVLAWVVYREQWSLRGDRRPPFRIVAGRTAVLLVAEFGPAELLDTLLVRPALMMAGVLLLSDTTWGLLAGKLAADLVFYTLAALSYTLTRRLALRKVAR